MPYYAVSFRGANEHKLMVKRYVKKSYTLTIIFRCFLSLVRKLVMNEMLDKAEYILRSEGKIVGADGGWRGSVCLAAFPY